MQRYVVRLRDIGPDDAGVVGAKARRLADLLRRGVPVPDGFVVTTGAYERWASGGPEACGDVWDAVREAFVGLTGMDGALAVAVRSSAASEDEVGQSFAGQYDTFLGVRGWDALVQAVQGCWDSLEGDKARAYSPRRGGRGAPRAAERAMAVIVQIEVPAEVSGVLFTLNPQTGREDEMLVEASWGLGEAVVGGLTSPDRFVIDSARGSVRDAQIGDKKVMVVTARAARGVTEEPVPEELRRARTLDDDALVRLMRLGMEIQEEYGLPQDVEWAYSKGEFYILQTRPLTAFSFAEDFGQWTSANFREVMPGFASYLSQSMSFHHDFARATEEVFRRIKLLRKEDEGTAWAATFFGHGYWNVGATKRVAARVPGFRERSFDRTVGIVPAYEGDGIVTPWTLRTIASALPVLFALRRHYRLAVEEARAFTAWFDGNEQAWNEVDPTRLDDAAVSEWARFGVDLHWRANRWALVISLLGTQAQDDFHQSVDRLNRVARARKAGELISEARLLTGITRMATAAPLGALWELARRVRGQPAVLDMIRRLSPEELAAEYSRRSAGEARAGSGACVAEGAEEGAEESAEEFWALFRQYVSRFRYMSEVDEDLAVPRWDEDVSVPLAMLKACLAGELGEDPQVQLERQRLVREEEERRVDRIVRSGLASRVYSARRASFRRELELVRRLCWWREETRIYLSRARYQTRRFLREQGRRWAHRGLLDDPDDVFWMSRDELLALLGDGDGNGTVADFAAVRAAVRRRQWIRHAYRNFVPPPVIVPGPARALKPQTVEPRGCASGGAGGQGVPHAAAHAAAHAVGGTHGVTREAARVVTRGRVSRGADVPAAEARGRVVCSGLGCSAGTAEGRVRVVRSLEEAGNLRKGEVLVAPFANPGWMPLLNLACALVLEEGGLLSHSAVVAREYGIPAVLQVEAATTVLHTGDRVVVDGAAGTVELIESAT